MAMFLPQVYGRQGRDEEPSASNRVADALYPKPKKPREIRGGSQEVELDATFSFSSREVLQRADFETMTSEEITAGEEDLATYACRYRKSYPRFGPPPPAGRPARDLRASLSERREDHPLRRRSPQRAIRRSWSRATFRADEPLLEDFLHFLTRSPRPRPRDELRLRHADSQHQPLPAPSRRGRRDGRGVGCDRRLVGRNAHRQLHAGIQPGWSRRVCQNAVVR